MGTEQDFSGFYAENKNLAKEYIETRIDLFKLQGIKILSRSLGLLIVVAIVSLLAIMVLFFLGMSFAWWIARLSESNIIGFASAAGLFLLLLIIIIAFRKSLFQDRLVGLFIRQSIKDIHDPEIDKQ